MATVAELRLPDEEFALEETTTQVPDVEFEVLRIAAGATEGVVPFVWAKGDEEVLGDAGSAIEADPSVEAADRLADVGDAHLYRMEWTTGVDVLLRVLEEERGSALTAIKDDEHWFLRVLFPTRDALSRLDEYCRDRGLGFDVDRIYDLEANRGHEFGLGENQLETLTTAHELGHFRVPREPNLAGLGDELGITHQSASERVRRSLGALVGNGLSIGTGRDARTGDEPRRL